MCGRFTLHVPASVVAEQFELLEMPRLGQRFNIAPTQPVAVVRLRSAEADGQRELTWMRWGLIPSWADDPAIGNRMINARAETVADKPAFRTALRRRRCLVVADGFYEWKRQGARRQPYYFRMRDERPFGFAGLWDTWVGTDHKAVESCTLLTTDANPLVRDVHDRMPVILAREDYPLWLDRGVEAPDRLTPLLHPYASEAMTAYPVSPRVNSPANDESACIEPAGSV